MANALKCKACGVKVAKRDIEIGQFTAHYKRNVPLCKDPDTCSRKIESDKQRETDNE